MVESGGGNNMWKAIVAGTAALAIAGTSLVYAQQRGRMEGGERWRPNTEDLGAFGEARLAALKAGLVLTPEQEKNWPAFEQAARDFGKLRLERMSAMRTAAPTDDPVERLRQRGPAPFDTGREGPGREHRWEHFRERFGGREGGRWFHGGPQRTDRDSGEMEHSGAE